MCSPRLSPIRRRSAGIAAASLAGLAWCASLAALGPRQQLREAVAFVAGHAVAGERAFAVGLPDDVHRWYAALMGVDMPGTGPYGRDAAAAISDPSMRWCVLLYPRALAERRAQLEDAGFAVERSFGGWIDQGDGAILVLRRR